MGKIFVLLLLIGTVGYGLSLPETDFRPWTTSIALRIPYYL